MKIPATASKHLGPHAVRLIEEYANSHNLTNFREALVEMAVELRTYERLYGTGLGHNQHPISTQSAPDQDTTDTPDGTDYQYKPTDLSF